MDPCTTVVGTRVQASCTLVQYRQEEDAVESFVHWYPGEYLVHVIGNGFYSSTTAVRFDRLILNTEVDAQWMDDAQVGLMPSWTICQTHGY